MNIKLHTLRIKSLNEIDNMGLYHIDFLGDRFYCRYWMLASHHRSGYKVKEWSYENLPRYCGYDKGWNKVKNYAINEKVSQRSQQMMSVFDL